MSYGLGLKTTSGKAALQGSIVHLALEWMGRLKKRGKTNVDPMWLLHRAWDELTVSSDIPIRKTTTRIDRDTGLPKEAADFTKCRVALETVLNDEFYNPYNLKIVDVEKRFATELPGEEWKCFDGENNESQFTKRGFVDLIHELDEETIEVVDWKTGKMVDFYTQTPIDSEVLTNEVQPRLYHLAAYLSYPQYKNIIVTFYYANDGGPVTTSLSSEDIPDTIAFLHKFFNEVKRDTLLRRNRSWRCRMCGFNKGDLCTKIWSDLHTMGEEYLQDKYKESE